MSRLRKKDHEDLSEATVEKVIKGMHTSDSSHPTITKKEACQILKIAYNPARLERIIEDYNDKIEFRRKRRLQNRGKPARDDEISQTIRSFLRGDPITDIAGSLYRTVPFIRNIIERVGIPTRGANKEERQTVGMLPEQCVSTEFETGEVVWAAREHALAKILNEYNEEYKKGKRGLVGTVNYEEVQGSKLYSIYVYEWSPHEDYIHFGPGSYSTAFAYDLGSLKHLEEYNIDLKNIS